MMCGITGFSGDFSQGLLQQMTDSIAHRGPDAQGIYHLPKEQIGLGHRRLSIIDLSPLGHQPMWDIERRVCVVFNGELYNYKSLRRSLQTDGFRFRSESDTEVLLNLYLRDGTAMLPKLNGIFAFALWDPNVQKLLLVRDGQGIKPLYYSQTSNGLLFSSEIKALLRCKEVDTTLSLSSIDAHLTYQWCPAPDTILESVKKVEPGHAMWVQYGQVQKYWSYYDLPYRQSITQVSPEDAIKELQQRFSQAVERQLIADVPVGAFLSGGLDSSAIVALAQRVKQSDTPIECFTIGFTGDANPKGEGRVDDLPYARQVAQYLNVPLHTIYVGPEVFQQVERMVYHLDEPEADFAPIHVGFISQMAREHGIKVLLSGSGGDDLFTGYRRHTAQSFEQYWSWLPLIARKFIQKTTQHLPQTSTLGRRIAKAFQHAHRNGNERIASYFHCVEPHKLRTLYTSSTRQQLENAFSPLLMRTLETLPNTTPALNKMLYLEGKHFLADHNLNYTDKMSMSAGVEVRVPFLDPDLIDFAARLPIHYKQRFLEGKWILKKAMEPYLPHDVIYRPKTGFGVPMRRWLKVELKELVAETLNTESIRRRGLFEPRAVQKLIQDDQAGRVDGASLIFALITLELWMKIFIDRQTSWYT